MTLAELEYALNHGLLECQWRNGEWHAVRRNGATRRWKRDASRFIVPCKTGFKDCFRVGTRGDVGTVEHYLDSPYLRVRDTSKT